MERTFVLIKPDGVRRGLVGEIITTFERTGLRLVAMKLLQATSELATKHYPDTPEWYAAVGKKTLEGYSLMGKRVEDDIGTEDPTEIGRMVKSWLIDFFAQGDVVAIILEGNAAVRNVRRIVGHTLPFIADPGSIRGRYSLDSPDAASVERRPVYNLVHASSEVEEAKQEIALWFPELTV